MLFSEKALSFSSRNSPPKKEQLLTNVSFFNGEGVGGEEEEEGEVLRDEEGNNWGEPAKRLLFCFCDLTRFMYSEKHVFLRKRGGTYLA